MIWSHCYSWSGPGFNLFAVADGGICTPEVGVLEGVTRKTVIELANGLGFPVEERAVPAEELGSADEVFVTSTAGGVMPITAIDGEAVDDGSPGPVTLRLREAYWEAHEDPRFATPVASTTARVRHPGGPYSGHHNDRI